MRNAKRYALIIVVLITCIGCDQATKTMATAFLPPSQTISILGDTFRLQLAHNQGGFLSLGAALPDTWRQGIFSFGVAAMLLGLLGYALFAKSAPASVAFAYALLFAGGASNLADRLRHGGYVVDFLNFGLGPLRTGIFNVADMAITAGALILVTGMFRNKRTEIKGVNERNALRRMS